MQIKQLTEEFSYTGHQLKSLFNLERAGLQGSSLIAWSGPCEVKIPELVDMDDRIKKAPIFSQMMVHFLGEFFHRDIFYGIFIQRLLGEHIKNYIADLSGKALTRKGDDLYMGEQKLNVSIATQTPLSTLVHFGVNVSSKETPVSTISLNDLGVEPAIFSKIILDRMAKEVEGIELASTKVLSRS